MAVHDALRNRIADRGMAGKTSLDHLSGFGYPPAVDPATKCRKTVKRALRGIDRSGQFPYLHNSVAHSHTPPHTQPSRLLHVGNARKQCTGPGLYRWIFDPFGFSLFYAAGFVQVDRHLKVVQNVLHFQQGTLQQLRWVRSASGRPGVRISGRFKPKSHKVCGTNGSVPVPYLTDM